MPLLSKRAFVGLLVLSIGVMFLLDTTDTLGKDASIFGAYWPVLLIAFGLWRLTVRGFRFTLTPLVILTVGIVFLLAELNVGSLSIGRLGRSFWWCGASTSCYTGPPGGAADGGGSAPVGPPRIEPEARLVAPGIVR